MVHSSPPAEHTLVGTGQAGSALHAAVALDAVEGVFVAAASSAEHGLGPATHLHTRVGAHHSIACHTHTSDTQTVCVCVCVCVVLAAEAVTTMSQWIVQQNAFTRFSYRN